jgi:hypothetical protein
MPSLHSFYVHSDAHPRLSNTDELMIVHRNQLVPDATLYIGAHGTVSFEVRTAADREAVETATPTAHTLPAGGKMRLDLPGANKLDLVTKITPLTGQLYVWIASMGEFDTYLKQVNVPSI